MAGAIGTAIGDFGGAVTDLFASGGSEAESKGYTQAATLEGQNATLAKAATGIQVAQTQRSVYQASSSGQAAAGGNGLALSGSAGDILRSTAQQGALATSLIQTQGGINENAYKAEEEAYTSQASAADATAKGQQAGGALDILGGIASLFSFF